MNKCNNCQYCDFKDKWNREDYTRTYYCSKRHKLRFLFRKGCKHYEEYIPKPYVE